jgi:hypothetical protein
MVAEVTAATLLLAALTYRRPLSRWGLVASVGAAIAVLVNLHAFPLMAWYTVDGILLVALGLVLVEFGLRRRSNIRVDLGLLFLGAAVVTKQSFAPAAAIGLARLAISTARAGWPRPRRLLLGGLFAVLPATLYLAVIGLAGGFPDLVQQLTSARFIWGRELVTAPIPSIFSEA